MFAAAGVGVNVDVLETNISGSEEGSGVMAKVVDVVELGSKPFPFDSAAALAVEEVLVLCIVTLLSSVAGDLRRMRLTNCV
jgi:hypothetical protein